MPNKQGVKFNKRVVKTNEGIGTLKNLLVSVMNEDRDINVSYSCPVLK